MPTKVIDTEQFKMVENRLKLSFAGIKINVLENGFKFHLKEIDNTSFILLKWADRFYNVTIKRSGTGLTIFILAY